MEFFAPSRDWADQIAVVISYDNKCIWGLFLCGYVTYVTRLKSCFFSGLRMFRRTVSPKCYPPSNQGNNVLVYCVQATTADTCSHGIQMHLSSILSRSLINVFLSGKKSCPCTEISVCKHVQP